MMRLPDAVDWTQIAVTDATNDKPKAPKSRDERLAEALRVNLSKRKALARGKAAVPPKPAEKPET